MSNEQILGAIDPEYVEKLVEQKREIDNGAYAAPGVMAALALGSIPVALAALSNRAYGQTAIPAAVKTVFDFALALEIFENEFYKAVLGTSASPAQNAAFATVRAAAIAASPTGVESLKQIQKHEAAHVATLQALGATNVFNLSATSFDFTGARGAGNGPFAAATTNLDFLLTVAQGAEDTGVRAYKGQAPNLMGAGNQAYLEGALRIHSVEARHAARIRRIRRAVNPTFQTLRLSGTIRGGSAGAAGASGNPSAAVVAAFDKIYGPGANSTTAPSEANATQAGIDLTSLPNVGGFNAEAFAESFDEPLDRADVVAIVQPFFIPSIQ